MFALLDTEVQTYMGDEDGPTTFEDKELAELAARIVDVRLKQPAGRTRVVTFDPSEALHLHSKETPEISAVEAMELLESGRVL